jgi:ABC-type uncharacterized transport system permease subunit
MARARDRSSSAANEAATIDAPARGRFPAMALLGALEPRKMLATAAGTLALLALSRIVWRTAIRSYTSASS